MKRASASDREFRVCRSSILIVCRRGEADFEIALDVRIAMGQRTAALALLGRDDAVERFEPQHGSTIWTVDPKRVSALTKLDSQYRDHDGLTSSRHALTPPIPSASRKQARCHGL